MAHELAHIKNRDVLIMTVASFFASVASMIMQFAFFFGSGDDDSPAGIVVFIASALVFRHLLLPAAGAVALPRVQRRPRRRPGHRPAQRPGLGAHDHLRHHGPRAPA